MDDKKSKTEAQPPPASPAEWARGVQALTAKLRESGTGEDKLRRLNNLLALNRSGSFAQGAQEAAEYLQGRASEATVAKARKLAAELAAAG